MKTRQKARFIFLLFFLCAAEAPAQPKGAIPRFSLGAGAIYSTTAYQGADENRIAIPLIMYSGDRFFIRGTESGMHIFQGERLRVDLLGKYRFAAYEAGESESLVGVRDRKGTVEAGMGAQCRFDHLTLSGQLSTDLLNEHGGQVGNLRISRPFRWRMIFFAPYLGISLYSDQFSNYYYGVESSEAVTGRPEYELGWTVNSLAGFALRIGLSRTIMLNSLFGLKFFDQEIADSPIIDQDKQFFCMISIAYGF